jgi:putative flippase GtrA
VRRLLAFAWVSIVPTTVDVGLLVVLREGLGWPVLGADAVAITVASVASYGLHRVATFRSSPYFRWVRQPVAFAGIALVAGVVDAVVLRTAFAVTGYTSTGGLLAAKALSLGSAAAVRALGYRWVLQEAIRDARTVPSPRPVLDGTCRLSVVVPAYREAGRIGVTVHRLHDELADVAADGGLEVVVVDDGSGDGTADEAVEAGAEQVVQLPRNRGKGAAVRTGMLATRGRVVVFTDADLAYDPAHLREALQRVERGWDVVIGSRRHPASAVARATGLRQIGSRVVNRLSAAVLLARPRDTQCGLKAFRGDVARSLFRHTRVDGFAFDIEVLHLVERAELSLDEMPVRLDETGAPSTVRIGRDVFQLASDLVRIRRWSSAGAYDRLTGAVHSETARPSA